MKGSASPSVCPAIAERMAACALQAVATVHQAVAQGLPADDALSHHFRKHRHLGGRDRRFIGDVVFSWFRWRGWLLSAPLEQACALAWALDATASHPAAEALGRRASGSADLLTPSGHLPLNEKARRVAHWLHLEEPPSSTHLVPRWVADTLAVDRSAFLEAIQHRPPTWLRAQKGQEEKVLELLQREGIEARRHKKISCAISVSGSSPLRRLAREVRSLFEIQDLASQAVGLICAPHPGERWWDVCAGGGGKTLHLADMMQNLGEVIATDIRPDALRRLRRRATRAGASCLRIAGSPHRASGFFDGVLVDAPCTGLGTWSRNPDARWRAKADEVDLRAEQQWAILTRAAAAVRPGGRLVYSVCTLTQPETLGITERFLNANPRFHADEISHPLTGKPTLGPAWIYPWEGPCIGMYLVHFTREE